MTCSGKGAPAVAKSVFPPGSVMLTDRISWPVNASLIRSGITLDRAPYLGPIATDARGLLQWIEVERLVPASVRDVLFTSPLEQ